MRLLLSKDPFAHRSEDWLTAGTWPASWIAPESVQTPAVWECRCTFTVRAPEKVQLHVSADERYQLCLDGEFQGRGPERGDPAHWYFDTYELDLAPGEHILLARVWNLGSAAPRSQISLGPGFICSPGPDNKDWLNRVATGRVAWEARIVPGWSFEKPFAQDFFSIGYNTVYKSNATATWRPAKTLHSGAVAGERNRHGNIHLLRPALLPAQRETPFSGGTIRHIETLSGPITATSKTPIRRENHLPNEIERWSQLLTGQPVTVLPQTQRRILVDLEDYVCAFTQLHTTGGAGSVIRVHWAESLFEDTNFQRKGNRSAIEGKFLYGVGDRLEITDSQPTHFEPPLWRAGRYVELVVQTRDEPLQLTLRLLSTGYPLQTEGHADAGPTWATLVTQCERTIARSCHDAFIDGPFYEQMMWAGDCLQNALTFFVMTPDARPALKALELFAASRAPEGHHAGLPAARWPARDRMQIAPYALYWIALLKEYAFWRDDLPSVRRLLPTARAILFGYESFMTDDGLLGPPSGWNFIDWVPGWGSGIPPQADRQPSAILNWQFVWAYHLATELETACGEAELAALWRRKSTELARKLRQAFWHPAHNLFSDDLKGQSFSEHTQVFALLSGQLTPLEQESLGKTLTNPNHKLARATVSFSHHLFEAYRILGHAPALLQRLENWRQFAEAGLFTTPEAPEPSRSDCHAWSAHPLFHLHATLAGIRPATLCFDSIQIKPMLANLPRLSVTTPHPKGAIHFLLERKANRFHGRVISPPDVPCTISLPKEDIQCVGDVTEFTVGVG